MSHLEIDVMRLFLKSDTDCVQTKFGIGQTLTLLFRPKFVSGQAFICIGHLAKIGYLGLNSHFWQKYTCIGLNIIKVVVLLLGVSVLLAKIAKMFTLGHVSISALSFWSNIVISRNKKNLISFEC